MIGYSFFKNNSTHKFSFANAGSDRKGSTREAQPNAINRRFLGKLETRRTNGHWLDCCLFHVNNFNLYQN